MSKRPTNNAATPDSGAALLSVMMVVAAMSVAALVAVEAISRATQIAQITRDRGEVHWLTLTGETVGGALVDDLLLQTSGQLTDLTPGVGEVARFPLERGFVVARLTEASNCFNLNALAKSDVEGWSVEPEQLEAYRRLLTAMGFGRYESDQLADALADWIDTDTVSRGNGAEDAYYERLDLPYRSAGGPLAGIRELRSIGPYSPDVISALADVVCVRPEFEQSTLNMNTLRYEQSALLVSLLSDEIEPVAATNLVQKRPPSGWSTIEAILAEDELMALAPDKLQQGAISLQSDHFLVDGSVTISGIEVAFEHLYGPGAGGATELIWRRYGDD